MASNYTFIQIIIRCHTVLFVSLRERACAACSVNGQESEYRKWSNKCLLSNECLLPYKGPLSWQVCPSLTNAPGLITPPLPFPKTNSDIEEASDENTRVLDEDSYVDIELLELPVPFSATLYVPYTVMALKTVWTYQRTYLIVCYHVTVIRINASLF